MTGASTDDILRRAEQEAASTGTSTDDIVRRWRRTVVVDAGRQLEDYRDVPQEVRSFTCDTVTHVLADDLDGDARADPSPLIGGRRWRRSRSTPSAGAQGCAAIVQAATADLDAGRPATLSLLVVKTGVCAAVGS